MAIAMIMAITATIMYVIRSVVVARFEGGTSVLVLVLLLLQLQLLQMFLLMMLKYELVPANVA